MTVGISSYEHVATSDTQERHRPYAKLPSLLQFQPKALSYILYKKPPKTRYSSFNIPKRDGASVTINAPSPELKLFQRNLSDFLQNCAAEINEGQKRKDQLAHGFKRDRSIVTNAVKHQKKRYVFNIDLKISSDHQFRPRPRLFHQGRQFHVHPKVATILAQIACHEKGLPQGSPCSPVISNLVGHILDIHLCRLASSNGCTYSRYADDITFSTNKPDFPGEHCQAGSRANTQMGSGRRAPENRHQTGFSDQSSEDANAIPRFTPGCHRPRRKPEGEYSNRISAQRPTFTPVYSRQANSNMSEQFLTPMEWSHRQKLMGRWRNLHGILGFMDASIVIISRWSPRWTPAEPRTRFDRKRSCTGDFSFQGFLRSESR